jgi:hypothetical protein
MGGKPFTALNIAGIPRDFPEAWTAEIFRGGFEKMKEAKVLVAGGHTVQSNEALFGFAVTGLVDRNRVLANSGAKAGDLLYLTKPLGMGAMTTAAKQKKIGWGELEPAARQMATLNDKAATAMNAARPRVHGHHGLRPRRPCAEHRARERRHDADRAREPPLVPRRARPRPRGRRHRREQPRAQVDGRGRPDRHGPRRGARAARLRRGDLGRPSDRGGGEGGASPRERVALERRPGCQDRRVQGDGEGGTPISSAGRSRGLSPPRPSRARRGSSACAARRSKRRNTLAGLHRALDLGLDGIAYDVRACATGEAVLLRDATIDRTTDGEGRLAEKTLVDLDRLDAGGWFRARFRGERPALLEEALDLEGSDGRRPRHLVWLRETGLVPEVARVAREFPGLAVHVAAASRETCLEARDAGLAPMLVVPAASEDARAFVRDERIAACAVESRTFGAKATGPPNAGRWGGLAGGAPRGLPPLAGIATREAAARPRAARSARRAGLRRTAPAPRPRARDVPDERGGGSGDCARSWTAPPRSRIPSLRRRRDRRPRAPTERSTRAASRAASRSRAAPAIASSSISPAAGGVGGDPIFFVLYRWPPPRPPRRKAAPRRPASPACAAPRGRSRSAGDPPRVAGDARVARPPPPAAISSS